MNETELFRSIASEPYEDRGILNSEMALIIHTARRLGIEAFIESGRARGHSTYLLAKYLPDVIIHSVELRDSPDEMFACQRLMSFTNVRLTSGDGSAIIPELVKSDARRTAILCDGPKGEAAVAIIRKCFKHRHVMAGFIHDMRRLDHGLPSPHRAAAVAAFPRSHRFSDDYRLVASSSWMDANVRAVNGPCGPAHEAEFGSYGPTVGVFFNKH